MLLYRVKEIEEKINCLNYKTPIKKKKTLQQK